MADSVDLATAGTDRRDLATPGPWHPALRVRHVRKSCSCCTARRTCWPPQRVPAWCMSERARSTRPHLQRALPRDLQRAGTRNDPRGRRELDCSPYMNEIAEPWRREAWQQHLNKVVVAGRRMHYLDVGDGPVVVLVHGLASEWSVWFRNISVLALDHRVIAVDLPGFGRSDSLGGRVEMRHYVGALTQLLDQLDVGGVRMVGHSLGGIVAQQFATRYPSRTAALVLVATGGTPDRRLVFLLRGLAASSVVLNRGPRPVFGSALRVAMAGQRVRQLLLSAIVHDPAIVSRELAEEMVTAACRSPGTAAALKAALPAVRQQDLRSIACPTLIVGGGCDRLVPVASLDYVADRIAGARRELMPDAGHHPMFECPDEFNDLLCTFLQAVNRDLHANDT
jgi:pimeloyl-ACP methyl ester carboxylesterase